MLLRIRGLLRIFLSSRPSLLLYRCVLSGTLLPYCTYPAGLFQESHEVLLLFHLRTQQSSRGYLDGLLQPDYFQCLLVRFQYVLGFRESLALRISIPDSSLNHQSSLYIRLFSARQAIHLLFPILLLCAEQLELRGTQLVQGVVG